MKNRITESKVMHSASGYYIGREEYDFLDDCYYPYCRESDYYKTKEEAEEILKKFYSED